MACSTGRFIRLVEQLVDEQVRWRAAAPLPVVPLTSPPLPAVRCLALGIVACLAGRDFCRGRWQRRPGAVDRRRAVLHDPVHHLYATRRHRHRRVPPATEPVIRPSDGRVVGPCMQPLERSSRPHWRRRPTRYWTSSPRTTTRGRRAALRTFKEKQRSAANGGHATGSRETPLEIDILRCVTLFMRTNPALIWNAVGGLVWQNRRRARPGRVRARRRHGCCARVDAARHDAHGGHVDGLAQLLRLDCAPPVGAQGAAAAVLTVQVRSRALALTRLRLLIFAQSLYAESSGPWKTRRGQARRPTLSRTAAVSSRWPRPTTSSSPAPPCPTRTSATRYWHERPRLAFDGRPHPCPARQREPSAPSSSLTPIFPTPPSSLWGCPR